MSFFSCELGKGKHWVRKARHDMSFITLLLLATGVSMDAFAVAICKGLAIQKLDWKKAAVVGLWFGGFQALMPTIGYVLGIQFADKITAIDHWIAFALLVFLGVKMIKGALGPETDEENDDISPRAMFILAIATSIDALAIGITLAFLDVNILAAVSFIGITTFLFSVVGVKIGHAFGTRYKSKAEILGGIVLIVLGVKILLEHLNIMG